MGECSVARGLVVEAGTRGDYEELAGYHYRDGKLGPYAAIFVLRRQTGELVGVIVYCMPAGGVELRGEALGGYFEGLGSRAAVMKFINERVRVISRVIIEPRYRGLGLAARLVRETMGLVGVPIVEALAVMGQVNPFFEKAGMRAFYGQERAQAKTMREALSWAGIEEREWIDPAAVCEKINNMDAGVKAWLFGEMGKFLAAYGRKGREVQSSKFNEKREKVQSSKFKVQSAKKEEVRKCVGAEVRKCPEKCQVLSAQCPGGQEVQGGVQSEEENAGLEMVSMVFKKLGDRPGYFVKIVRSEKK